MQTVLPQLSRLSPEPFDCIVHVGAGADADATDFSVLNPKHVILIEADPEAHAALAERFQNAPNVTVINALVTPQAGETAFHRFSLPSFNAPLGLGRLREIYPRIGLVEELRINSQGLHHILRPDLLGDRNLLILDTPGQEAAVLRTLDDEFLKRFTSVVALTCAESWQQGAEPLGATLAALRDKYFELAHEASDDPAWPCVVLIRDTARAAMQQELDQRARLLVAKASQIHQQAEQINALTTEHEAFANRISSLESENSNLATRHTSLVTALGDLQGQHFLLVAERDALAQERDQIRAERDTFAQERNQLIIERNELATRISSLESEHSDLVTRHASLATQLEALQGQHSSLIAERDALAARLASLESEHSNLATRHTSLVAERDDLVTRHSSLVTESEALRSDLSAKSTLLDVLTKGRIAQDEQMDKLLQEQKTLTSERDALASRVSDLISQVKKLEAHAKLIDEEFGKAEGQIDLIKDIFLREAIR